MVVQLSTHIGPSDGSPLTDDELRILLALPRAAKTAPSSVFFRLPRGEQPSQGFIDVTCLQAYSIVACQVVSWRSRLSVLLGRDVGPGVTVCLMVNPFVHVVFLHLALWSLGCTVQYINTTFDDEVLDSLMKQAGCDLVIYSGRSETWATEQTKRHGITMAPLDESEYACTLAKHAAENPGYGMPEWPAPKRPSPAIVIHSSSSTSFPKLMSFSLHYYTLGLAWNCAQHLASTSERSNKRPRTHPRLLYTEPFWQTFVCFFLDHLVTATPCALVPTPATYRYSGDELAAWIEAMQVGGLFAAAFDLRHILLTDEHTELLRSLYAFTFAGSSVDELLSDLIAHKQLKATNTFGISELGRLLRANRAPYMYLRPFPDFPPPLAVPLPEAECARQSLGREVQLWYLVDSCPQLAHVALQGGIPLNLEPFPGPGPAHGQLAMNLQDVFREVRTEEGELAYIHIGRLDDYLRLRGGEEDINASQYESEIRMVVESTLSDLHFHWRLDTLQMFGTNLAYTALVVQVQGDGELNEVVEIIRQAIETVNDRLKLIPQLRVDPIKRLLVTTSDGRASTIPEFAHLRLSCTHKHTLRRWQNAKVFRPWLEHCVKNDSPIV